MKHETIYVDNDELSTINMTNESDIGLGEHSESLPAHSVSLPSRRTVLECVDLEQGSGFQTGNRSTSTSPVKAMFSCKQCGYGTMHKGSLTRHQRIHTGEFIRCHLCRCRFLEKYKYVKHLEGHAGHLVCKVCGKRFTHIDALKSHEKRHLLK